jgi:hypothetical protein
MAVVSLPIFVPHPNVLWAPSQTAMLACPQAFVARADIACSEALSEFAIVLACTRRSLIYLGASVPHSMSCANVVARLSEFN